MPYCRSCGSRVNDTDRFCSKCGTSRAITTPQPQIQTGIQTNRNTANALKQLLLSTYTLTDSLDAVFPAVRQKGHQLREFHKKDVMCFLLYLSAADGKVTSQEKDLLNILFDQNINEQGYVQLINNLKINSEYIREEPLTIQVSANVDKTMKIKNISSQLSAPVFIEFYKSAGQAIIACDGYTDIRETQKFNEYINHLNAIVSRIMNSTDNFSTTKAKTELPNSIQPMKTTASQPTVSTNDKNLFEQAVETVLDYGSASVSVLQRRLGIGYPLAARLIDELEKKNIIGPYEGSRPRKILITKSEWLTMKSTNNFSSTKVKAETPFAIQPIKTPVSQSTPSTRIETSQNPKLSYVPEHASTPETVSTPAKKTYPASIYKVGKDIPVGKFKVFSDTGSSAYYSICNDPNGDDIITNDSFINQVYVDIQDGQYLELSDCHAVPIKDAVMFNGTKYCDGEYLVGQEIAPGEYKVVANPGEDGYYSLETFAFDGSRSIDSNRTFNNVAYVAPKQGQILVLKGCTLNL